MRTLRGREERERKKVFGFWSVLFERWPNKFWFGPPTKSMWFLSQQIIQLHTTLQTSRNVILLGCPGSGKSTIYTTLASALNSMNGQTTQPVVKHRRQAGSERRVSTSFRPAAKVPVEEIKDVQWPRVDLSIVFPKSLTCEEASVPVCLTKKLCLTFIWRNPTSSENFSIHPIQRRFLWYSYPYVLLKQ